MSLEDQVQERNDEQESSSAVRDIPAWLVSLAFHLTLMLVLVLVPAAVPRQEEAIAISSLPNVPELQEIEETRIPTEFAISDAPQEQVGAESLSGTAMALSAAPLEALESEVPVEEAPQDFGNISLQQMDVLPAAHNLNDNVMVRGTAGGVGATGAAGAVDRIALEILNSLEQRKTLVVWLFDRSVSMDMQRKEVNERLNRVYKELGVIEAQGNPAFTKYDEKPLLTAVMSFGQTIELLTKTPTDDLQQIQKTIASIPPDSSGMENTFTAVQEAAKKFAVFRNSEPRRNVMLIVFSDEVGNDQDKLDKTVTLCRNLQMPVYVVGVPAPFGRKETLIKYVDPDPNFDQRPQWAPLDQGPESYLPEMVYLRSPGAEPEEAIDSGFGPYSLTRLCYETGGDYFTVHPNRDLRREVSRYETAVLSAHLSRFFDDTVMRKYRPEYVSLREYQKLVAANKARTSLVAAAQLPSVGQLEAPMIVFPKRDEAQLANLLTRAQQAAALLEPRINALYDTLKQGEADRPQLTTPRWQAGYDLAMGRVLAAKVRTEAYNLMLAKAKQGMAFKNPKNDTWRLVPADTISVASVLEKQANQARSYLQRVVTEHPDTPWALYAQQELDRKFGWEWEEDFTNANPPQVARAQVPNNPQPNRPVMQQPRMLPKPPPLRKPPAL